MSFILDAIAKSEQERQQQEMPGARILATPVANVQKPRLNLSYLLVGALLLNAVILAIWMQTGPIFPDWNSPSQVANLEQSNAQDKVLVNTPGNVLSTEKISQIGSSLPINQSSVRQQSTAVNQPRDIIQSSKQTVISKLQQEQLESVARKANESTRLAGAMNNAGSVEATAQTESRGLLNKSIVTQPGTTEARQSRVSESVQSEPPVLQASGDTTAWVHIGPDSLSNKTFTGLDAVPQQSTQNTAVMYRKVSSLRDLPVAVRKDLPRVIFSGHLYSSNPRSSVVFMDTGRPMKQGQEIADELYLHEITPTGVIVEFRGYLIDVGVLQNWTLN